MSPAGTVAERRQYRSSATVASAAFCQAAVPSSSTCLDTLGVAALGLTVTALPPTRAMIGAVPASFWEMASSSATMSQ